MSLLGDLGAYAVEIEEDEYSSLKLSEEHGVDIHVPTATPVDIEIGHSNESTRDSNNNYLLVTEFPDPSYLPHVVTDESDENLRWYYLNNHLNTLQKLVVESVDQEYPKQKRVEIEFNSSLTDTHALDLNLKLQVVGVARRRLRTQADEYKIKYNITFHDKKKFIGLGERSRTPVNQENHRAKRASAGLALLRTQFWGKSKYFREDLIMNGMDGPDGYEWEKKYDKASWMEWLNGQASSNVINIPLVLYGPKGGGRSSVIATWDFASDRSLKEFLQIGQGEFKDYQSSNYGGCYKSIMRGVKFPCQPEADDHRDVLAKIDDVRYRALREVDTVRLCLKDTCPAATFKMDVRGRKLPLGIMCLVLDAVDTYDKMKDDAYWLKALIGPPAEGGEVRRYPPLCILLTKTNMMSSSGEQILDSAKISKLILWLSDATGVDEGHILEMPTLVPVDDENSAKMSRESKGYWNYRKKNLDSYGMCCP